eukprot:COSAG06_NODE_87_length_24962_cov_107.553795_29_plen_433_part_00
MSAAAAAQTDGGYLGADFETFFSAVTSGAAGLYVGTLLEDAGISTDLTITPGQTVSVSGDPSLPQAPSWGDGGFTVQERGSLALAGVAVAGAVSVLAGGSLSLASMAVDASMLEIVEGTLSLSGSTLSGSLSASDGSSVSLGGCGGQLTGLSVIDSSFAMDASSTTTLGGTISLSNAGAIALQDKTLQGLGAQLKVTGGTQLSLSGCTLEDSVRLRTFTDSSLSLASMAVPAAVLGAAVAQLSGAGSTLRLAAVTVPELPDAGELTGTMTVGADGSKATDPPRFGQQNPGIFTVSSGPCAVSEGGRCVGRPGGYLPSERCEIAVGGGGGVLDACGVFDTIGGAVGDYVTLPDGSQPSNRSPGTTHYGLVDCPAGAVLVAGGSVRWTSDGNRQGGYGCGANGCVDNGCGAKGLCGLPESDGGLGGGWQICFAR